MHERVRARGTRGVDGEVRAANSKALSDPECQLADAPAGMQRLRVRARRQLTTEDRFVNRNFAGRSAKKQREFSALCCSQLRSGQRFFDDTFKYSEDSLFLFDEGLIGE